MTTTEAFAALMPDSVGFRTRYRSEPEMIGHYPWTYSDARRRLYDRPECEYEDLYTAEQMRAMFDAATERAAKLCEGIQDAPEEKRAMKAFQDASGKGVSEELARGNHWSTVSTFNAGLKRAAAAIRNRDGGTQG